MRAPARGRGGLLPGSARTTSGLAAAACAPALGAPRALAASDEAISPAGRRPSRPRPRRAAGRRRRRPRSAAACGRCGRVAATYRPSLDGVLMARTSGRFRQCGQVAGGEPALAGQPDAVHEGAVGRADVLDVDAVAARLEARVTRRGVLVALELARRCRRRGRRERGRVDRVTSPWPSAGLCHDDQPAELARDRLRTSMRGDLLRREDHRLLREAQVSCRRTDDPPDEEVEEDEEGDLEGEERVSTWAEASTQLTGLRENLISVEPIVNGVPSSSFSCLTRCRRPRSPFVESRSTSV